MPTDPVAVLVAVIGLAGLIVSFFGLTVMSLRRDEHTPNALPQRRLRLRNRRPRAS